MFFLRSTVSYVFCGATLRLASVLSPELEVWSSWLERKTCSDPMATIPSFACFRGWSQATSPGGICSMKGTGLYLAKRGSE